MHNPATAETWQTAFGKDFVGMAQGDNKTGQNGMNSVFVMTHSEIPPIPGTEQLPMPALLLTFTHKKPTLIEYA
jgi:hypothetical protein